MHQTSRESVEYGIREIIELIWMSDSNQKTRRIIFPKYETVKPTNSEFLSALYQYLRLMCHDFTYVCPTTGSHCKHSREIIEVLRI